MDNDSLTHTYLLTVDDKQVKLCLYKSKWCDHCVPPEDIRLEVEDNPKATIEQIT
jgi:hypothetical protein